MEEIQENSIVLHRSLEGLTLSLGLENIIIVWISILLAKHAHQILNLL